MSSSSSSSDIPFIILNPNETYILPAAETRDIMILFTGKMGTNAVIVLNSMRYSVGSVGGALCWNIGKNPYTFSVIGEQMGQISESNLYVVTWKGYSDNDSGLLFSIQWMSDYNAEIENLKYRYGGFRYSLRGPAKSGPDEIIPEVSSLYPFPRKDNNSGNSGELPTI